MVKSWINYFVMFSVLVLVQVIILNHVHLGGFLNPYIYILFILLLPVSMQRYQVLLLAFIAGLVIDIFSNSLGLHTSATVLLGFLRAPVINILSVRETEQSDFPGISQMGFRWFFTYALVLTLVHHFFLFYLEVFTFSGFFRTFTRSLISSVFTLMVLLLSQFLVFKDKGA